MQQASLGFVRWFLGELFGSQVNLPYQEGEKATFTAVKQDHSVDANEKVDECAGHRVGKQEKEEPWEWEIEG